MIKIALNNNLRVGVFPVSDSSWRDIGDWDNFKKNSNSNIDF